MSDSAEFFLSAFLWHFAIGLVFLLLGLLLGWILWRNHRMRAAGIDDQCAQLQRDYDALEAEIRSLERSS